MKNVFTKEDVEVNDSIWAIITNEKWELLIQDHIKLNSFTIPIWKVKKWQSIEDALKEELFEELWITILKYEKILEKYKVFDFNWVQKWINMHFYKILNYTWTITNNEPYKHKSIEFMSLETIKKLSKISEATKILLEN